MNDFASLYLDTIPMAMRLFRNEMRKEATQYLSIPQFRILANINRGLKSVNEISALHGVSQPAVSKMVDSLVKKSLVTREVDINDRRCVILALSPEGKKLYNKVRKAAHKRLEKVARQSDVNYESLVSSLEGLKEFLENAGVK